MSGSSLDSFAALLDRLAFEPRRNGKLALLVAWLGATPDPERGYALAAMTGGLVFPQAKAGMVRALIAERCDPVLFALSYDYVGDLSETVALLWEPLDVPGAGHNQPPPELSEVVEVLATLRKADLPSKLAQWLDGLDATGRWALLKLITGGLRIGVSARLARTAAAQLGAREADEIEQVWHGLKPPYLDLFAWLEGRGERPVTDDPVPFRPPMLAHAIEDADFDRLKPQEFAAEWKWDGIRIQAASGLDASGKRVTRLYSRSGEEITAAFPELAESITFDGAVDGELLILREGRVQSFNVLQQRLNRKQVTAKLIAEFPAHLRAYDLLVDGETDIRALPFAERRRRLEALGAPNGSRLSISPMVSFESWEALTEVRGDPASHGVDAEAVEGLMLKRLDSAYLPGRPKGLWFKWKRDPMTVDAVLMYAQRGHGKRSSFYSDFTFGVWRAGAAGDELTPVGKAYFGFTDDELKQLDRFV
ncbi:MAG: cisplatin damage response ATP-dependent DNA ligase, partial [Beijerinckiaceae bacterium]